MKSFIIFLLALGVATTAGAQLYKYVDKDGKTVYTDQPPANLDSKQINSGGRSTSSAAPAKTALQRDKELDKGRKEVAEKAKKAGEESEKLSQMEQRCTVARSNYQMYSEGGRIQKNNEKGERELMNDAEIGTARDKARRDMEEACKK